jgi:hypothetical protein
MMDRDIHALREGIVLYLAQIPDAKYVVGHIPYSTLLDDTPGEPWDYMTILRSPESRLLSNYYYNASNSNQEHFAIDVEIEEFLESERGLIYGNSYVRCFMGECSLYERQGTLNSAGLRTPEAISAAKRNLDKFAIIGTIESMSSFEAAIDRRYGTSIKFPHLNHNPTEKYPKMKDLPEHVRRKIEEICAPDREVYEHAIKNSPGWAG